MEEQRFGMLFDKLPAVLRPFTKKAFTPGGQAMMNRLRVPQTLGAENHKLVAGSPLLLGVMLDRREYRPGELSGFYSLFSMGAAMENLWLTTVELGMGIQFISFPMEAPPGGPRSWTCWTCPRTSSSWPSTAWATSPRSTAARPSTGPAGSGAGSPSTSSGSPAPRRRRAGTTERRPPATRAAAWGGRLFH